MMQEIAMKRLLLSGGVLLLCGLLCEVTYSQTQPSSQAPSSPATTSGADTVPRLIRFAGTMRDSSGTAMSGTISITFALYDAPVGGTLLWSEKQMVQCNDSGHYTVLLGSTQKDGLPMDLFVSRQARWLNVTA